MIDLCCLGDILEVIYRTGWWTEEVVNEGVKIKARAMLGLFRKVYGRWCVLFCHEFRNAAGEIGWILYRETGD